ncbi:MAG: energy transducer TonB [Acidobacteriota bacterium]|nr:energy transducer TonB [Acidobacteriota bacterium]
MRKLTSPPLLVALQKATVMGGGGGEHGPTPVTKGHLPKFAETQITPPKAPPMEQPKIRMPEPTIEVQNDLKMASSALPNLGMPNSPIVDASMGNGSGTGVGAGKGSGIGSGSGGNYGGGLRQVGGAVSMPVVIHEEKPEFSEEARKAKLTGRVVVGIWVDENGNPTHVQLLHGIGMRLDENAIAAVKEYKFKPAMDRGKSVTVALNIAVDFEIE